jgi:hypothetical protein
VASRWPVDVVISRQPTWNEIETGRWRRECQCGAEGWIAPAADDRVRLDHYDPRISRHAGQCEFVSETDAAVLRHLLRVKDGMGECYWWVECGACATSWQVPHYVTDGVG